MKYNNQKFDILGKDEYPKIVRDKIPEIIKNDKGIDIHLNSVKGADDHLIFLCKKMIEEAVELNEVVDRKCLIKEMADILEVVDAICYVENISKDDLIEIQNNKCKKRGGFKKGLILKTKNAE